MALAGRKTLIEIVQEPHLVVIMEALLRQVRPEFLHFHPLMITEVWIDKQEDCFYLYF